MDTPITRRARLIPDGGADFAVIARTNSDDRTSALEGGDLGWVQKGKMVPEFEEVMMAGEIDEISQPFETEFGLHIVQVLERRMHDDTVMVKRQKARSAIRRQKIDERKESWLRRIREFACALGMLAGLAVSRGLAVLGTPVD